MAKICFENGIFSLDTENTSYRILINEHGHLEHIYYGARIAGCNLDALRYKRTIGRGSQVLTEPEDKTYSLDDVPLEWSGIGRGDYRNTPAEILMPDGSFTCDFAYQSHEIKDGATEMKTLPTAYGEGAKTLIITLKERASEVYLRLYYTVYSDANVITRRAVLKNCEDNELMIRKLMSMMMDLPEREYVMTSFDGDWISEAQRHDRTVQSGIYINESTTGASSNRHNAGIILSEKHASEDHGRVYGFNLIYSGNHHTAVEKAPNGMVRVMSGISPHCFMHGLVHGEEFETPEAVLSFSQGGFNGLSHNLHSFVNEHIVRGDWKGRERPILINSWEAYFFKYKQGKLLRLARRAKKLGVELFVLDDGWFGARNSDTAGLGDYEVNRKKLKSGIDGLSKRIEKLGLRFGLWFEPEAINPDSELYRAHPEYAIRHEIREPAMGRNQLVLDLCNPSVRDYIVENVGKILDEAKISYVKWDMNRHMSDMHSPFCKGGEFFHRYVLGLYEVLHRIFTPRPHILLEGCSSGGNRFDLGMLCFCQQLWASDDTDPIERIKIQKGLSYLYPQSVIGAHVSQAPHQQTLRNTPLATRFNVSAFGALGYELDLSELSKEERRDVARQTAFYKRYRKLFQYGTFYRFDKERDNMDCFEVSEGDTAVAALYQTVAEAAPKNDILFVKGLDSKGLYRVQTREQRIYVSRFGSLIKHLIPIRLKPDGWILRLVNRNYSLKDGQQSLSASGEQLMAGLRLNRQYIGTGYDKDLRLSGDFGSHMYIFEKGEEKGA
ncbi:MAG: alpha-galactosidase [Clostridia bacterium]|nr:alpha-galactosidase [Clostridia bacterium]